MSYRHRKRAFLENVHEDLPVSVSVTTLVMQPLI